MSLRPALLAFLLVAACDDDGNPTAADASDLDAFQPPWFTPHPGDAHDWDIQLVAPFDVATPRKLYVVDLWDVAPMMTFDYGGTQVNIKAGPLANQITTMHAGGAKVACRVDVGAIALDDPDASLVPGFEASPPDRPTNPKAASVIGWSALGDPGTRYLDLAPAARAMWEPILFHRFEVAKMLGCDAIAVAHVDELDPGFAIDGNDAVAVYTDTVAELHNNRELSAGILVDQMIGKTLADGFADSYDWALTERCAEFDDCAFLRSFTLANKALFGLDFVADNMDRDNDSIPDGVTLDIACARTGLPEDWIQKDMDGAFRPSSAARSLCP